jgi:hypothetical protein
VLTEIRLSAYTSKAQTISLCFGAEHVDLIAAPSDATVWIEGRSYVDFDTLLPIERKRLPTPKDKDRDEREYVIEGQGTTGGMQRFKAGLHGAKHTMAAMIGSI